MESGIKILFEDNQIIVAYKPRGILAQSAGDGVSDMLTELKRYLKAKYEKTGAVFLGLVHRLDRNTAGLMVFARTSKAAKRLALSMQNGLFTKKYLAIIEGELPPFGSLINCLKKDEVNKRAYEAKDGKIAILEYKTLKSGKIKNVEVSLVDITLKTGRFHQIRFQMALAGHPLYGDKKYGSKNSVDELQFPLEAYSLSFPHPVSGEILTFEMASLDI